ncbi:putative serine protease K12H4.7 [Battus philenor]|uniref:putative serine protease K12H4.7 n=1 Tax=Battus philenor TaxID=42288 RepID=UPI0035D0BFF2
MRYFAKTDFWKSGGPIYLFLGGEGEASPNFLNTGIMYELAKETNGAMYASEHRYYGKSMPVQGTSVENFKYLSVYQALEDNAHLLRIIKLNPIFYKSKIIVIGGSYAGNLAAWMRLLYPELVYAAIASSAPVLAKKDFYEYLETVNEVYGKYGTDDCLNEINQRFIQYETMFETADGIEKLKEEENICNDVDMSIPENKQLFFLDKASKFMSNTQYGTITVIKDHCAKLNENPKELNIYGPSFYRDTARCYNYDFNYMINQTYKNQMTAYACWLYQTCTTFGYFQSTSSRKQPFTNNVPVEFYVKMCTSTFGSKFNDNFIEDGIELVNKMFGGLRPNVTKVVFVNGDMDPWSKLSVLKNISSETPAIFIPRSSHCRDLFSNREGDHEELKEARKNIKDLIKNWIGAEE